MDKLAIIIPAYKATYLHATLESIARQTNKNFKLYIGDDASPFALSGIVDKYRDRIDIAYTRFTDNLGGWDLVKHWERCIDLVVDEDWLWFFSDDDIMEELCVDRFFDAREAATTATDVYHYNLKIIDSSGSLVHTCPSFPRRLSSRDFFHLLYTGRIDARMPEFIFSKHAFLSLGRFQNFDIAFRSDNATIIKLAFAHGIQSLSGPAVLWRHSDESVSASPDLQLVPRKAKATIQFFNWIEDFFQSKGVECPLSNLARLKIIIGNLSPVARRFGLNAAYAELKMLKVLDGNPSMFLYSKIYLAACKIRLTKAPRRY